MHSQVRITQDEHEWRHELDHVPPMSNAEGRAWLDEGETALLNQVKRDGGPSADRIRQYEYMPFSMLISLIRGAKATLFPSLYEGFGIPPLEAHMVRTRGKVFRENQQRVNAFWPGPQHTANASNDGDIR